MFIDAADGDLGIANGLTASADGWYVSSVFTGVINEYDHDGHFVREILRPPAGEGLGADPYSTGTPNGLGVTADGTLWYADLGLVVREGEVGPGPAPARCGSSASSTASPRHPRPSRPGLRSRRHRHPALIGHGSSGRAPERTGAPPPRPRSGRAPRRAPRRARPGTRRRARSRRWPAPTKRAPGGHLCVSRRRR
ncbi:MAG: hypothetical protein R2695_08205 [Acidimicrobiales bacterium]